MPKLRISHIVIQPVLVWDDGEELNEGPAIEAFRLPASKVGEFIEALPDQVAEIEKKVIEAAKAQATEGVAEKPEAA